VDPRTQASARVGALVADKYRLERVLGSGGMGTVYEATHTFTDRRVAVKLLHPAFIDGESVTMKRFLLEAKAAAAIQHPSVVEVLDAGMADGAPYVVFELLQGETLSSALAAGHLNQGDLLELVSQVLEVLELAHARGIVHRDIKPENVFVCRGEGGVLRAKVLDFGIARRLDGPLAEGLTQQGAVLGTPYYMSPEQMEGASADGRADLWAVGAMLYRGLSGHIPFESRSYAALLVEVLQRGAPPLATRRPDLAEGLRRVVDRALTRDLSQRWQDAASMRQALLPFMRPRPSVGAPRSVEQTAPAVPPVVELAPSSRVPLAAPMPAPMSPPDARASEVHAVPDTLPPRPGMLPRPAPSSRPSAAPDPAAWERALGEIEGEIEALRVRTGDPTPRARASSAPAAPDGGAWLKKLFGPKRGPS
jgi:serine/threonine-protein kinase